MYFIGECQIDRLARIIQRPGDLLSWQSGVELHSVCIRMMFPLYVAHYRYAKGQEILGIPLLRQ
jgi:hypothetical protein